MSMIVNGHYTDWKKDKNCHVYCPFGKQCRYEKGEIGIVVDECPNYYHLDDLRNEAIDIEMEIQREREQEGGDFE